MAACAAATSMSYAGKVSQKLEGHRFWDAAVFKPDPITGAAASAQNVNDRVLFPQTIGLYSTQTPSDLHVAIMNSRRLRESLVRRFDLMRVYEMKKPLMDATLKEVDQHVSVKALTPTNAAHTLHRACAIDQFVIKALVIALTVVVLDELGNRPA